ncbi:MAG TPA: hypothetical protein DEA08_33545 [Planctomycetes bacterium]|nr:hypothetical protein [Planctomycetota bacterium]|tara:strand:- start:168 stop:2015 length:1848 start_codon:yes stop_codon:yes gene_type:complete
MAEKRRWNLVADLAPLHRRAFGGKVLLAKRFRCEANGNRDFKALIQDEVEARKNKDFDPSPLLAVFRVRSLQHPKRMRSVDESFEGVKQSSVLSAELTLWEMDFDGENGQNAKLGSVGCKLVRRGRKWRVEIDGGDSADNEHVPYLRIVGDGDTNTYAMIPVDPLDSAVGSLSTHGLGREGKHYEIAFQIKINDPGYFVGPGEDSGRETEGQDPVFPKWWQRYHLHAGRQQPSRRELPLLYSSYLQDIRIDQKELLKLVRDYYTKLSLTLNSYWDDYRDAVNTFNVRTDRKEKPKPVSQPSLFGILGTAYTLASLFLPQLRSAGILLQFVERWKLPDKHVSGDKILDTWDQVGSALDTLKQGKKVTLSLVKDLDSVYAQTKDPKKRKVEMHLHAFISDCHHQAGMLKAYQARGLAHIEELLTEGIKSETFSQLQMRRIHDEVEESYDRLNDHQPPDTNTLLRNLIVSFMNAHQIGLYTFSAKLEGVPWGPHSHVAGHDRFLEEHVYRALLEFRGGIFKNPDGELLVTEAQQRKYLPGLKLFKEFTSRRKALQHYSKNKTLEYEGEIDADTRHWLKTKDHLDRDPRPSADFKYYEEDFEEADFVYQVKMWTETTNH